MPTQPQLQPQAKRTTPSLLRRVRRVPRTALALLVGGALLTAGIAAAALVRGKPELARLVNPASGPATIAVDARDVDSLATAYAMRLVIALAEVDPSGEGKTPALYSAGYLSAVAPAGNAGRRSPSGLTTLERQRIEHSVDAMNPAQREQLLANDILFYSLTLSDTHAEDGDLVAYDVDGHTIGHVRLTNAERRVTVPARRGVPAELGVTGIHDGEGGITLQVTTGDGQTAIGVIGILQRVVIRVTPQ